MTNINELSRENTEIETILLYGFIATVIGGGAGVYLPVIMGNELSSIALSTYIFAMLAPFWVDALLPEPYWKKLSKVVRMRIGLGCAFSAVLAITSLIRDGQKYDLTIGILGSIIVLIVWFFLALYSGRFAPDKPPIPPGGNKPSTTQLLGGGLQ